ACCREPIPAFHYMVALAGADTIPLVPYALFGSQALADGVASALVECDACLLANHGVVALGSTPAAALDLAREVEQLAEMYLLARSAGTPVILSAEEMSEVHARFATYGRRPTDNSPSD
ncbi:MAG: class II aldolase/adducin family protein, partial [Pseudomonadota bacterium]